MESVIYCVLQWHQVLAKHNVTLYIIGSHWLNYVACPNSLTNKGDLCSYNMLMAKLSTECQ